MTTESRFNYRVSVSTVTNTSLKTLQIQSHKNIN